MTLEEWSYVSQIAGVVLVVITLIYLAVQVRQGTPRSRKLWELCSGYFNDDFVKMVEEMMNDVPESDFWHRLAAVG